MALLCCQSGPEGPRKQWRRRGNIESTPTERTALLKQQPEQRTQTGTKDRASCAAHVANLVAMSLES